MGSDLTSDNLTKEFKVQNGNEYRMLVYVTDTLGRTSDMFYFFIIASAAYREVWVFDGNNWKKGKSLVLRNVDFIVIQDCNGKVQKDMERIKNGN